MHNGVHAVCMRCALGVHVASLLCACAVRAACLLCAYTVHGDGTEVARTTAAIAAPEKPSVRAATPSDHAPARGQGHGSGSGSGSGPEPEGRARGKGPGGRVRARVRLSFGRRTVRLVAHLLAERAAFRATRVVAAAASLEREPAGGAHLLGVDLQDGSAALGVGSTHLHVHLVRTDVA